MILLVSNGVYTCYCYVLCADAKHRIRDTWRYSAAYPCNFGTLSRYHQELKYKLVSLTTLRAVIIHLLVKVGDVIWCCVILFH